MGASKKTKVETGIYLLPNGNWEARSARFKGGTNSVSVTFGTKEEARVAKASGDAARAAGGDVEVAMRNCPGAIDSIPGSAAHSLPLLTNGATGRTLDELLAWFIAYRRKLSENSDPTFRRSLSRGINSLRPTTFESDLELIENHIQPTFGELRIIDIESDVVEAWVLDLATRGYAVSTQDNILVRLRMLVGLARRSEQPDDFPWKRVAAIPPQNPMRPAPQPDKWGGEPGSLEPVLPFVEMNRLAVATRATYRVADYLIGLAGLRPGEAFGLHLEDLFWRDGFLWLKIRRQLLNNNDEVEWTKADASYRTIPVAPILAEYLIEYCSRHHNGYDLRRPARTVSHRRLIVNPAGRDLDGTFLPAIRAPWAQYFAVDRDAIGLGHAELGYELTPHHLRKSFSTYLLHGPEIITAIEEARWDAEPEDPSELIEYLRTKIEMVSVSTVNYSPINISAYLGHRYDGKHDPLAASATTLNHYNLAVNKKDAWIAVATTIDRIARHEIGFLCNDPDLEDELPVHFPGDSEWLLPEEAAEMIGINRFNITVAVQDGRLEGHKGWLADGGWRRNLDAEINRPAMQRLFVSRTSAKEMMRVNAMLTLPEVAQKLGLSSETVISNFIDTGKLPHERTASAIRLNTDAVEALIATIHDAVVDCIPLIGAITIDELREAFNVRHGGLFVQGRVLTRWVERWVVSLVESSRLARRPNGRVVRAA